MTRINAEDKIVLDNNLRAINKLRDMNEYHATEDLFIYIFGSVGKHLYSKFERYGCDILQLTSTLDYNNLRKLFNYLGL